MKKVILLIFICKSSFSIAQNIGVGTNTPDPSAKLDVTSTNSGFLPPRMTFAQRNAIPNPAAGLMIYCTDCGENGEWQGFNGTVWMSLTLGTPSSAPTYLPAVTIGRQKWSTKNLDVVNYRNGDPIPQVTDATQWSNLTTGAWCWYNNDSAANAANYGRLYNWYALTDPRGLAPQGWHIPSDNEWNILVKNLDPDQDTSIMNEGYPYPCYNMEAITTSSTGGASNCNPNSNNGFVFSIQTGGLRGGDWGPFVLMGQSGNYWSRDEIDSILVLTRTLSCNQICRSNEYKKSGLSVRVLRDSVINNSVPNVNTKSIDFISPSTCTITAKVTFDGGVNVTARGFCWSTSPNPTVNFTSKTNEGQGTGSFSSHITNLNPNTTYHIRAYAINALGTAYSSDSIFTTSYVTPLPSVTIGSQVWSSKNLDVATYRNGDPIPQVIDSLEWTNLAEGAWCWYKNDSATYASTYGRLYNWYAVTDPRGLAPQGWHVATESDWNKLIIGIDPQADTSCPYGCSPEPGASCGSQSYTAGGALKNTYGWNSPNEGATNSSGFAALPGGRRGFLFNPSWYFEAIFDDLNNIGYWWFVNDLGPRYFALHSQYSETIKFCISALAGLSVRLVMD